MRAAASRLSASHDVRALSGIAATLVFFFAPVWAKGRLFITDGQYTAFFAPLDMWSNAWIGGWPAGADTAAYVWYPVRIAMLWTHLGFDVFVMAAYVVAATGTYAYLRILSVSPVASAIAGLGYAFSGFMIGHLGHTSMIQAAAWVPWMFAGVEGAIARERRRWLIAATIAVAMSLLAGHMQIAFYGCAALAAYLIWRFWWCRAEQRVQAWGMACLSVVTGVLLAAPQLLVTATYLQFTPRAALDYGAFVAYSLPLQQLPTMLFPFVFGHGNGFGPQYFGYGNFAETCCYVPFLSCALAIPAIRFRGHIAIFWALLAAGSMALALGGSLPPFANFVFHIPGFNLFRAPARNVMELGLAMAVLSGFGVQMLLETTSKHARRWYSAAAVVLALAIVIASIPSLAFIAEYAKFNRLDLAPWTRNPAIGLGLVGIVAGLIAIVPLALHMRYSRAMLIAGALLGFVSFAWFAEWRLSDGRIAEAGAIERGIAQDLADGKGRILYTEWNWRPGQTAERARILGIPSVNWYGPLIPDRAKQLLRMLEFGAVAIPTLRSENAALDLYGVRYVAVRDGAAAKDIAEHAPLTAPRWELLGRENGATFYRNTRALPLAWLTSAWRDVPSNEALDLVQNAGARGFDPRREALVTGLAGSESPAADDESAVHIRWTDASTLRAEVDSSSSRFLVISVNNVDGWHATVDGVLRPLYETDYALMGLPIERGHHEVVLSYRVSFWKYAVPWTGAFAGLVAIMRFSRRKSVPES